MYKEVFGKKLRKAREEAGYTQQQIEDITGIKRTTLSRYESNEREPDIETLGKLADFLYIDLNWLYGVKGGKNKK